jgi:hypothetical protein
MCIVVLIAEISFFTSTPHEITSFFKYYLAIVLSAFKASIRLILGFNALPLSTI